MLNRNKPAERKGKVLIINGEKDFVDGKNQNTLSDDNVARLAEAFRSYDDEDLFARVVELAEIEKNDWNLNIARYVDTTPPPEPIDTAAELRKLKALTTERDETEAVMLRHIGELGYE